MRASVAKYEVVSVVMVWSPVVWDVTLGSLRYLYQRCRGSCPLGVSGMSMKTILKMEAIDLPEAFVSVYISVCITFPKIAIITSLQIFWNKVGGFSVVQSWYPIGTSLEPVQVQNADSPGEWRQKGRLCFPYKAFPYQHRRCPQLIGLIQWF